VKGGDMVYFQIHYFANGGDLKNLKLKMNDIDNKVFNKGTLTVNSVSTADNTRILKGSSKVVFGEKVKLVYKNYSLQKDTCRGVSCQSAGGTSKAMFTNAGYVIGDVAKNHYGNLIVGFKVVKVNTTTNNNDNNNTNTDNTNTNTNRAVLDLDTLNATSVSKTRATLRGQVNNTDAVRT
jgi:hypothetical protein